MFREHGDGKLDVVAVNGYPSTVVVLLNLGDGTFGPAANFDVGLGPNGVVLVDFDGDGRLDVATCNMLTGSATVTVLLNRTPAAAVAAR